MKIFFDTEFAAVGNTLTLISAALVTETGDELYVVNDAFDWTTAEPWLVAHVKPFLGPDSSAVRCASAEEAGRAIAEFVAPLGSPQFWAYNSAYDWCVLTMLYGRLVDRPTGWPTGVRDVKEYCRLLGNPTVPAQVGGEHDALADARWTRDTHQWLRDHEMTSKAARAVRIRRQALMEAATAIRALGLPPTTSS